MTWKKPVGILLLAVGGLGALAIAPQLLEVVVNALVYLNNDAQASSHDWAHLGGKATFVIVFGLGVTCMLWFGIKLTKSKPKAPSANI